MHRILKFASLLLIVAGCVSTAQAGLITYNLVDYASLENGWTLSGTITTDGTIGLLSSSDITSWSYTLTNGATVDTYSSSASEAYTNVSGGLTASATQLTIGTPGSGGYYGLNLQYIGNSVGQGEIDWVRSGGYGSFEPGYDAYGGNFNNSNLWFDETIAPSTLTLTNSDNWVIGTAATAVPEPSSISMVILGGVGSLVVFARRRRSQNATLAG